MLLVAPDPSMGIAPERTSRVRALLDAVGTVPGVAVALPGGPDGVLDALILRPDGVLGLVPVAAAAPVPVGAGGSAAGEDDAASEIERLLALASPAPTAPRQVLPYSGDDGGVRGPSLVLSARAGTRVLGVDEVRAVFAALRLAGHVPDASALSAAGFGDPTAAHPGEAEPAGPHAGATTPVGGPGDDEPVVPAARSATSSHPPTPASPSHPSLPSYPSSSSHPSHPLPRAAEPDVPETSPLRRLPSTGRLPAMPEGASLRQRVVGARRAVRRREMGLPAWFWTWRGLSLAAAGTFLLALGAAALVSHGTAPSADGPTTTDQAATRVIDGVGFQRRVATTDATCDGHAYGRAAQFLSERPCQGLDRSLWTTDVAGAPMVVSVAVVRMGDPSSSAALKSLVDSSGTGNVSDLLREGRGYPGSPTSLSAAGYASRQSGEGLVVVETDRADGGGADGATLDRLARQALALAP